LAEKLKLSKAQGQDLRLRPRLVKLYGKVMLVFFKGIKLYASKQIPFLLWCIPIARYMQGQPLR
jgi:hypothetical protein